MSAEEKHVLSREQFLRPHQSQGVVEIPRHQILPTLAPCQRQHRHMRALTTRLIRQHPTITYRITRWDLLVNHLTLWMRNRVLQLILVLTLGWYGRCTNGLLFVGS